MESWITDFIEQFGYFGVFFLICVENVFPPIPSEVILTFSGFMTVHTHLTVKGVTIAATLGSVLGAAILYRIGALLGVDRLEKVIDRYGQIVRVKLDDIERADRWFQKYGYWTVLFCRMIPLIRSLISIPAGMMRMNFTVFIFFTTIGTIIWNIILVFLGAKVGGSWTEIVHYMDVYSSIVYTFLICIGGILLVAWMIRRFKRS